MLLENSENEETFLIYLFEWEPGLTELNSNFLPKWDTLPGMPGQESNKNECISCNVVLGLVTLSQ